MVGSDGGMSESVGGLSSPRTHVLGYSQPSLRDWFRYTLIVDLFSQVPAQISRSSKKLISDKSVCK